MLPSNGDVAPTKAQASPEAFPTPSPVAAKKLAKKRPAAEKPGGRRTNPRAGKRTKYERAHNLASEVDWSLANSQANALLVQEQLAKQVPEAERKVVPHLASAYGYSDGLSVVRTRMRKLFNGIFLKKGLTRGAFNQNQSFHNVTYKPGNSFFKYFTKMGKSNNTLSKEEKYGIELIKKGTVETVSSDSGDGRYQLVGDKFVCAGCQRAEAKKYAKNLCQTCYKRQRKSQEEGNGRAESSHDVRSEVQFASPEVSKEAATREWTGACPYCNRVGVKHYAKGKCMACYRKYRKAINRSPVPNIGRPVLLSGESNSRC